MSNILVSVSCITFNHAPFIKDCLDGFLMQKTNFLYEILIHDDASTDGTQEIIRAYQNKHPNIIKPIFQSENQYSQGQRGINIKYNFPRAQGKYIALCEGDDYWTDPYKLQKQVDFLEANPDYVIAYHDFECIDELATSEVMKSSLQKLDKSDSSSEDLISNKKWIKTLTMCFRNVVKDFPEEINSIKNGDIFLISYLGNYGKGKWMGNEIEPGVYREHAGGIWSSINTQRRTIDLIISCYWIMRYYERIGKMEISKMWFDKLIWQLNKVEENVFKDEKNLFMRYENQNNHLKMIKNSMPYKIGILLTSPVRMLKSIFINKNNQ